MLIPIQTSCTTTTTSSSPAPLSTTRTTINNIMNADKFSTYSRASDSVSVTSCRHYYQRPKTANGSIAEQHRRNKYNTLTPAEAKKITKFLNGRQPVRTASVLHKPRAPPIVVTNLDHSHYGPISTSTPTTSDDNTSDNENTLIGEEAINGSGGGGQQRQGQSSVYRFNCMSSHNQCDTNNLYQQQQQRRPRLLARNSLHDSESNLSFRSSLNITDSAYGSDRFQTMSVDLGNPSSHNHHHQQHNTQYCDYNQDQNKLSDDSYTSAKSQQSDASKLKSSSKMSLTSSTTRVFQNQFCNLKKFFRYMPSRRSFSTSNNNNSSINHNNSISGHDAVDFSGNQHNLAESISQICINRSQSPPVCPPPPKELKSMSYMENAINYSNYDEFTRARNRQTATLLSKGRRSAQAAASAVREPPRTDNDDSDGSESWQLTSLPISYERNLTTVFEEGKQNSNDMGNLIQPYFLSPPPQFQNQVGANAGLPPKQPTPPVDSKKQQAATLSVNKCPELERTINSLKDKLVAKEKELTEWQLKQVSSDYLIDQLESTISRLEKENAHLKAVVVKINRVNL